MASRNNKNKAGGIVFGPLLVIASVAALWKNETRFDYHRAARNTEAAVALGRIDPGRNVSYTGEMNRDLTLPGTYIETFTGYLAVRRQAEIYCWHRDEDDDGHVTWSRRWMNRVESNSRNSGLRQELHSGRILPPSYRVGDLEVVSELIEFVDSREEIPPGPLPRTEAGARLALEGAYLILRKKRSDDLGDERLSYRGIPVPPVATWFGQFVNGRGIADTSEKRSGWIHTLVRDTGVLHHLVAGDRKVALRTMKRHIERLKWTVRGIGSAFVVLGLLTLFSSLLRFLYVIPVVGRIAESGAFLLALLVGLPLAATTIGIGFLAGNPWFLLPIVGLLALGGVFLARFSRRRRSTEARSKEQLDTEYGHALQPAEVKKLEYREMAGMLATGGRAMGEAETKTLDRFARKSGIESEERENLLAEVRGSPPTGESVESHLRKLIRLSVADAKLTPQEVRSIREAASLAGYDRSAFRQLMAEVSRMAEVQRGS